MNIIFLGIGTNIGNRLDNLINARNLIEEGLGSIISSSSVYETEPWGFTSKNQFLNMVVKVETNLEPQGLLDEILKIEKLLGRVREEKQYISRVIDIDILLYNDQIIIEKDLKIPHPLIHERRFVLVPLCEIASEHVHPVLNESIESLLDKCDDRSKVRVYEEEK